MLLNLEYAVHVLRFRAVSANIFICMVGATKCYQVCFPEYVDRIFGVNAFKCDDTKRMGALLTEAIFAYLYDDERQCEESEGSCEQSNHNVRRRHCRYGFGHEPDFRQARQLLREIVKRDQAKDAGKP